MNSLKHSCGSILLETLISIVILGLIAIGSFYSYGFVYQRINFQRQQRLALGVLQGWMEETISSLLDPDPNNPLDFNNIANSLKKKEKPLIAKFNREIPDINDDIGTNIAFIEPNIFWPIYTAKKNYDNIVEIRLRITLSKNKDVGLAKRGLPITLYTNIYTDPNIYE